MKCHITAPILLVGIAILFPGCDQSCKFPHEDVAPEITSEKLPDGIIRISKSLDKAVELILPHLTDQDRQRINDYRDEAQGFCLIEGDFLHSRIGLLEITLYREFVRLGIFHGDDFWSIIDTAVSRRVRSKSFDLQNVVNYYRDYWAEQDIIAPLDIACPICKREMVIWNDMKIEGKQYFGGQCDQYHDFYFYHKDGWRTADDINGKKP